VALELTTADAGGGVPAGTPGHGLIGMRERAELFGGTLTAGPRNGGFEVHVVLPYES
jgi:signal transduction histidine kinase